jgi:hypothetical protein
MDDLKTELNGYLFWEFDVDGDESQVSENWPFELHRLMETSDLTIFEFHADEAHFALADEGALNYLPQAGMTVDDLLLQRKGATWIGARDPIDLSVVRLGDPAVPSTIERRRRLEALGAEVFPGEAVKILEGLLLCREQRYLALFGRSDSEDAVAGLADAPPILVPFPQASSWRRLAWGVGRWLEQSGTG